MGSSSLASWVAAAIPPSAVEAQETGRALLLWIIIAGGLLAFLLAMILVSLSRRTNRKSREAAPSAELDAWKAAAERLQPPTPPEE